MLTNVEQRLTSRGTSIWLVCHEMASAHAETLMYSLHCITDLPMACLDIQKWEAFIHAESQMQFARFRRGGLCSAESPRESKEVKPGFMNTQIVCSAQLPQQAWDLWDYGSLKDTVEVDRLWFWKKESSFKVPTTGDVCSQLFLLTNGKMG